LKDNFDQLDASGILDEYMPPYAAKPIRAPASRLPMVDQSSSVNRKTVTQ
jgi:hypothetical protein